MKRADCAAERARRRRKGLRRFGRLPEVAGGGSYRLVPFPEERRSIDIGDYFADDGKIRSRLGWEPRVGLRDGLARSLEYFREHAAAYW